MPREGSRSLAGSVLAGRYRLSRLLGAGGMGDVWEATNVATSRAVAIKRLRPTKDWGSGDRARARFVLEARTACAVEHPNVVEILDFVEADDEQPILVMELLRGHTLAGYLEEHSPLSVEETARLLLPVVSAVGTAHARGIVHRDLKPANIFLHRSSGETVVKVLDFGIAKWASVQSGEAVLRTETGATLGTPCYMAPEQALGERVIDHRADVWSLGVILYECIAGCRPVEGENAARVMVRLHGTGIMPLEKLVPGVPQALAVVVGRMLSRDPGRRPSSLGEVRDVLMALSKTQVPDFAAPRIEPASQVLDASGLPAGSTARAAAPVWRRAGSWRKTSAMVLAGIVASVWALVAVSRHQPDARSEALVHGAAAAPTLQEPSRVPPLQARVKPLTAEAPLVAGAESADAPPNPRQRERSRVASEGEDRRSKREPAPERMVAPALRKGVGPLPVVALDGSPSVPASAEPSPRPPGAPCERSSDCESRLCLALTCE